MRWQPQNGFHHLVPRVATTLKYWLPVGIWMALIFIGSGDTLSSRHTSRFLGPFIHWLLPALSPDNVDAVVFCLRKTGHVTEYAALALLLWRALRRPVLRDPRPWDWSLAGSALLLAAFYAATDEFHQSFVPTREGRVHDVVLDTCGAAAALLLLWFIGRRRKRW